MLRTNRRLRPPGTSPPGAIDRLVQAWDDRAILGGADWADEIDARLNRAEVILLLVTADYQLPVLLR